MKRNLVISIMLVVVVSLGGYGWQYESAQRKKMAMYCTPTGSKTSIKCGGAQYMACIELHPGICDTEDPMPSCCASSPDSPDRTAQSCLCCEGKKHAALTIPYDEY